LRLSEQTTCDKDDTQEQHRAKWQKSPFKCWQETVFYFNMFKKVWVLEHLPFFKTNLKYKQISMIILWSIKENWGHSLFLKGLNSGAA